MPAADPGLGTKASAHPRQRPTGPARRVWSRQRLHAVPSQAVLNRTSSARRTPIDEPHGSSTDLRATSAVLNHASLGRGVPTGCCTKPE